MKKLDHVILKTVMDIIGRLSEVKIDCDFTIESFTFQFPKMPETINTAAAFNEYVEGKVIPGFYNNVMSRFNAIATRFLEKNIYPNSIPDDEIEKIKSIFEKKMEEISAELLDATSKDLTYYNCDLNWLETAAEKLSCSYYLRSSLTDCVTSIFADISDAIIKKNKEYVGDVKETNVTTTTAEPKGYVSDAEKAEAKIKSTFPEIGKLNSTPGAKLRKFWSNGKVETEHEAEEVKEEVKSESDQTEDAVAQKMPGFGGRFIKPIPRSIMQNIKNESNNSGDVQHQSGNPESINKEESVKGSTNKTDAPNKREAKKMQESAPVNTTSDEKKADETTEKVLETPPAIVNTMAAPEIKLQFPTPSDIQELVTTPNQMVNFERPLVCPQYTNEMINKHFIIGKHVLISEADLDFFETSLLTTADWIEDYDKEIEAKKPSVFGISEFYDVKNYVLLKTQKIANKVMFMNPDDMNFVIIRVIDDSYFPQFKDKSNQLVSA